jgi:hypothetical protein
MGRNCAWMPQALPATSTSEPRGALGEREWPWSLKALTPAGAGQDDDVGPFAPILLLLLRLFLRKVPSLGARRALWRAMGGVSGEGLISSTRPGDVHSCSPNAFERRMIHGR